MSDAKPLILSVEDDEMMSLLIERALTGAGYRVETAADGARALEKLAAVRPDLILTDVMLPGMDGYELCARLQADPELALIPVIFLTALDSPQDKARALACGAVDFLAKPFAKDALLSEVRKHAFTKGRWSALKDGLVAAAWAPRPGRLEAFHRHLFESLDASAEKRAVPPEAALDLYAIAPHLGLTPAQVAQKAAEFAGKAYLASVNPESIQLGVLPAAFCRSNRVIAVEDRQGRAYVVSDPFDRELSELLARYSPEGPPRLVVTEPANLAAILKRADRALPARPAGAELDSAAVVDVSEHILDAAVRARASDVHVEPKEGRTVVRMRVDGDMRELYTLKADAGLMLITRFKALAALDVAERRKPQDGSMQTEIDGRVFVLRLATTSTPSGESLVIRLLEPWAKPRPLQELGMTPLQVQHMTEFARRNHGLVIVAGPTGSGKTTTVYSLLQHIDCATRSLISVEDPVEYRIPSANQQQVDEKTGLSFEALLKSSMRQDPDILFLGEMRDPFSAKMAVDFSSTGHLTISTIHTTNATTAIFRLERLGVTRGAMADSILGVVAQKLLKRLCACKDVGAPTAEEAAYFAAFTRDVPKTVARPKGCDKCAGSGYLGREGVYEIVKFYPEISDMIRRDVPIPEIRDFARRRGDLLATDHAIEKARALVFSPKDVYEQVLVEESEYRLKAPPGPSAGGAPDLPVLPERRGAPPAILDSAPTARVLVAEDDADTRALIARVLEGAGYAVTAVGDGTQALVELARAPFDLILSDMQMPGMDGLKLLEVKAQKGIATPVLFFSSQGENEARALGLGAADFIRKPVAKDALLARVRRTLGSRA